VESDEKELIEKVTRVETITNGLSEDMKEIKQIILSYQQTAVPRGEWQQRNNLVDGKFNDQGREIAGLRTQHTADIASIRADVASTIAEVRGAIAAGKTPWHQSAMVLVSIAAVGVAIISIFFH